MTGTLPRASYCVHPLVPGKEWTIAVDGERVGTVRQKHNLYGWCDKQGGHWFLSFDIAAEARANKRWK